jgi:high frequency lysogenization protein
MAANYTDRTIALAGIFQAASLVHQLASTGHADEEAVHSSTKSLFMIEADDVPSVYGGLDGVRHGLRVLSGFDGNDRSESNMAILTYVFSLMHLTHKLLRKPEMLSNLTDQISVVQRQKDYFDTIQDGDVVHPSLVGKFADIYAETISTMQPRIMVKGQPDFLQREDIVNGIRCLLLAGIRSAFLWEQLGGGRLLFLLRRKRFAALADDLLLKIH